MSNRQLRGAMPTGIVGIGRDTNRPDAPPLAPCVPQETAVATGIGWDWVNAHEVALHGAAE